MFNGDDDENDTRAEGAEGCSSVERAGDTAAPVRRLAAARRAAGAITSMAPARAVALRLAESLQLDAALSPESGSLARSGPRETTRDFTAGFLLGLMRPRCFSPRGTRGAPAGHPQCTGRFVNFSPQATRTQPA